MSVVYRYYDNWTRACEAAGVAPGSNKGDNLIPNFSKGRNFALQALRNAASELGTTQLSKTMFDSADQGIRASTIAKMFGGWEPAIKEAGLERHQFYKDELPLEELIEDFVSAFRSIGRIPSIHELARRSRFGKNTFSRKLGSYTAFKHKAIEVAIATSMLSENEQSLLNEQIGTIPLKQDPESLRSNAHPHHQGRSLNFRAFAYAPTYENEVVSLFSVVADELGFEIVCQRPAFPDCEARRLVDKGRQRYKKCLIEFELRSSDFKRHGHPPSGCDLVICWTHDWNECPVPVLELSSRIRTLSGWR